MSAVGGPVAAREGPASDAHRRTPSARNETAVVCSVKLRLLEREPRAKFHRATSVVQARVKGVRVEEGGADVDSVRAGVAVGPVMAGAYHGHAESMPRGKEHGLLHVVCSERPHNERRLEQVLLVGGEQRIWEGVVAQAGCALWLPNFGKGLP
eukprot:scaffold136218_cov148-Phaeocystis_antarctica.AAC.2